MVVMDPGHVSGHGFNCTSHRILLRLDDGSIIGDGSRLLGDPSAGVVRVPVERALEIGRAGEAELQRLERLLRASSTAPVMCTDKEPVTVTSAVVDGIAETDYVAKRPRLEPVTSVGSGHRQSGFSNGVGKTQDMFAKFGDVLDKVYRTLSKNKPIFYEPVDEKVVTDYYQVIKTPMCLKAIEHKVKGREYASAQDFCNDMRLVWANCKLYNKPDDFIYKLGHTAENTFEHAWTATGLSTDSGRLKRATAGVAAVKFDPDSLIPAKQVKSTSKSKPSRSKNGISRTKSHEVTSGHRGGRATMTSERMAQIAEELQHLSEEQLEGALTLIPPHLLAGEAGELELEFERLDHDTLRKIDRYLRNLPGRPHRPSSSGRSHSGLSAQNPSVKLDHDSSDNSSECDDSD